MRSSRDLLQVDKHESPETSRAAGPWRPVCCRASVRAMTSVSEPVRDRPVSEACKDDDHGSCDRRVVVPCVCPCHGDPVDAPDN